MYSILIPTHAPHFEYVKNLIISINKYCQDTSGIDMYIVVSSEDYNDALNFVQLTSKVNIIILKFKDIIQLTLNIDTDENNLLNFSSVYKYQSLKKILSVQYLTQTLNYEYVYVLDSECLFIRYFSFEKIIDTYIKNKKIYYNSKQRINYLQSNISKKLLITNSIPGWLLENYLWIYEDKIVKEFFNYLFCNIHTLNDLINNIPRDIFIEIVYYHYIYNNNHKYNYSFIDSYETLNKYIENLDKYISSDPSLLEDIRCYLNDSNLDSISNYFNDYSIENYKIRINEINMKFIKKTNIILINSGDYSFDDRDVLLNINE
jgi:hypothetical protein